MPTSVFTARINTLRIWAGISKKIKPAAFFNPSLKGDFYDLNEATITGFENGSVNNKNDTLMKQNKDPKPTNSDRMKIQVLEVWLIKPN